MKKLRWALLGCGDISSKRVAPALRQIDSCDLVAVSRANRDLVESFAREFGARKWYADWHEVLDDDEIEAVYIATPVSLHAEQAVKAAEAGKHVLCEKPMALTSEECGRMIDAAKAHNVKLGNFLLPPFLSPCEPFRRNYGFRENRGACSGRYSGLRVV